MVKETPNYNQPAVVLEELGLQLLALERGQRQFWQSKLLSH